MYLCLNTTLACLHVPNCALHVCTFLSHALHAVTDLLLKMDIDGPSADLLAWLVRARAHLFPQGWLDLSELSPYRAASRTFRVAVDAIIRGVLAGWARVARRRLALPSSSARSSSSTDAREAA